MKNISALAIVLIIVAGCVGFYGGMKYSESKSGRNGNFAFGQTGARGARFGGAGATGTRGGQGFRPVSGEIIAADDKSITVKDRDGSSKIVVLSTKTSINKSTEGTKTDLVKGEQVAVFGTENSDGSVTAQNVQLNPIMRGMQISVTPAK